MPQPYTNPYYFQNNPAYPPQIPYQDRLAQLQAQYQNTIPQAPTQAPPQTNQGLLWVQGETAARSYLVAPNSTVLLMDSDANRFYLKSADNAGMPNLRTFEYTEVHPNAPQGAQQPRENQDDKYVTREEYKDLQAKYMDILDRLNNFHAPVVVDESAKRPAARTAPTRGKGGDTNE